MPGIQETRRLPYSCEQMFDMVADVARYGEFLPWVVATRVRSNSETEMVADMLVGFKALREKFTSRVVKSRPHAITVHYMDGGCELDFAVDFTFRNALFQSLAGQYFDKAFRKMVAAFETRAAELYAHPVAGE